MTPERAIETLKDAVKHTIFPTGHIKYRDYENALAIAKTAIERCMVAKKPDYEGDGYDDKGELIYDTAYCPNCRHMFEIDYDVVKHCPNCGQLIDWSDTE